MNTRRIALTIFGVLIALSISIQGANAQQESMLVLLLPGVDEFGNLTPAGGDWCEARFLGSENREILLCQGEVINASGKAYVVNPCGIDVDECCFIGSMVISKAGPAHFIGEFQCPCKVDFIPCHQ
jgi:hypothetical protein